MRMEHWHTGWRWAFAACLVIVMALALTPPQVPTPTTGWDKANHALAFAVLAVLGLVSYPRRKVALLAGLLAYGGAIELLQGLTDYRSAEWLDLAADGVGLALGSVLAHLPPLSQSLKGRP
jgi:VanZ family protein